MIDGIKDKLETYFNELKRYAMLAGKGPFDFFKKDSEIKEFHDLREKLLRDTQIYKKEIIKITGYQYIEATGIKYDIWSEAFNTDIMSSLTQGRALNLCVEATNIAIGKIEAELQSNQGIRAGGRIKAGAGIRSAAGVEAGTDIEAGEEIVAGLNMTDCQAALKLFDSMKLHPRVTETSRSLFCSRHYAQSIFEAFKVVNNEVKKKCNLAPFELRGLSDKQLMAKAFDERSPLIKLNALQTDTDISEQEGFKFLFMGATLGIRNPKAHDEAAQNDPYLTLEYLAFASMLLKRIDFWSSDS